MIMSLVAMATATLIFFPDEVFELIEEEFGLYIFLVLLSTVSIHYVCFSEKLREKLQ